MPRARLSLVLPCYNEEANIEQTVRATDAWFAEAGIDGEIIAVDDGSRDGTRAVLERLAVSMARLRIVPHDANQGYGLAVRSGLDAAREEIIGFMDSDGQFRAPDLELLLPHLETFAFVTGRRARRADPVGRRVLGTVLELMNWAVLGLHLPDVNCGMKVFRRSIWDSIRPTHGVEKLFHTEIFLRLRHNGIAWKTVPVPHYPRLAGDPTGAKWYVVAKMGRELRGLRKADLRPKTQDPGTPN